MTAHIKNLCSACGSPLRPDGKCVMPRCVNGWSEQEKATRHMPAISEEIKRSAIRSTPPPPASLTGDGTPIIEAVRLPPPIPVSDLGSAAVPAPSEAPSDRPSPRHIPSRRATRLTGLARVKEPSAPRTIPEPVPKPAGISLPRVLVIAFVAVLMVSLLVFLPLRLRLEWNRAEADGESISPRAAPDAGVDAFVPGPLP